MEKVKRWFGFLWNTSVWDQILSQAQHLSRAAGRKRALRQRPSPPAAHPVQEEKITPARAGCLRPAQGHNANHLATLEHQIQWAKRELTSAIHSAVCQVVLKWFDLENWEKKVEVFFFLSQEDILCFYYLLLQKCLFPWSPRVMLGQHAHMSGLYHPLIKMMNLLKAGLPLPEGLHRASPTF